MFVASDEAFPLQQELVCDLGIGLGLPESHPVRGRVVRVQQQPRAGMAIAFYDLTEIHRAMLRGLVGSDPHQEGKTVKVWFESLSEPLEARVVQTAGGKELVLRSRLAFLRPSSAVVVYSDADAASWSGTLQQVTLESPHTGVPELRVQVRLPDPALVQVPRTAVPRTAVPRAVPRAAVERPPTIEIVEEPPVSESELLQQPPEPGYALPPTSAEADDDSSSWDLGLAQPDPCEQSHWSLDGPAVAAVVEPASRAHLWLWAAALLMVGITVAPMVHTKLWSRTWRWATARLHQVPAARPSLVLPEAAPVIVPETTAPEKAEPEPEPVPVPAPVTKTPRPNPHVTVAPTGRQALVIPLEGSTQDATHYRLANPDGLVVNLPKARPRTAFGDYRVPAPPFRLIWLRRRDEGVHVRVLFEGKMPPYRLRILDHAVHVVLDPEPAGASPP